MKIFSIFKKNKNKTQDLKPVAILRLIQEYVPEFYKTNSHFKESKEFLQHNEYGLALESLIEMADESGHYFSEDFWSDLATCADKIHLTERANFCRQQIIKNESEIGMKTPKGWTTFKLDDNSIGHHVAKIVENDFLNEIHSKDEFDELVKTNGFHHKTHGRYGIIYYIADGKVLEISYEISGVWKYDLHIDFDSLNSWTIPANERFVFKEKSTIREALLEWLKGKRIKTNLK
jgi:hypothetical protein